MGAALLLLPWALPSRAQGPSGSGDTLAALGRGEWPAYAGTYASMKYSPLGQIDGANAAGLTIAWRWTSPDHAVRAANARITIRAPTVVTLERSRAPGRDPYGGRRQMLVGPQGLPLLRPPWGSVIAIDMATGEHRWREAVGSGPPRALQLSRTPGRLGWPMRSFALVTKTVLLVAQSTLQVHDKVSGRLLAEVPLPAPASGAPMTYMTGGKQYVALPVGGESHPEELLALP